MAGSCSGPLRRADPIDGPLARTVHTRKTARYVGLTSPLPPLRVADRLQLVVVLPYRFAHSLPLVGDSALPCEPARVRVRVFVAVLVLRTEGVAVLIGVPRFECRAVVRTHSSSRSARNTPRCA